MEKQPQQVKLLDPVVDRISCVLYLPDYAEKRTAKNLADLVRQIGSDAKRFASSRYQFNYKLPLPPDQSCIIQAKPRKAGMAFMRLDYNPAKVGPKGDQKVRHYLEKILGKKLFPDIEKFALITRLDLAIDVDHVPVRDLLVSVDGIRTSGVWFGANGEPQTLYIGKRNRPIWFLIYDKRAERQAKGAEALPHDRLRVEVRLAGKYLRHQAQPTDIASVMLRAFSSVRIVAVPSYPQDSTEYVWGLFLDSARLRGLQAALRRLPSRLRKQYTDRLTKTAAVHWWTPRILQKLCTGSITRLGLFPISVLGNALTSVKKWAAAPEPLEEVLVRPRRIKYRYTGDRS
jgi:hypothetical protein